METVWYWPQGKNVGLDRDVQSPGLVYCVMALAIDVINVSEIF